MQETSENAKGQGTVTGRAVFRQAKNNPTVANFTNLKPMDVRDPSTMVKIYNTSDNPNPEYATLLDTGMDIRSSMNALIQPGTHMLIKTGIHVGLPTGWGIQVRSRSGLAFKNGIAVLNSPGTIDQGYTNEIGVILMNNGNEPFVVNVGDRVAQIVLEKVHKIQWQVVETKEELGTSDRGDGGFGSTGVK